MPQLHRSDSASSSRRLFLKAGDAAVVVMHHDPVMRGVLDLLHGERRDAAVLAMGGEERGEVGVGEAVAAHHQEGVVAQEGAEGGCPAGRAHELVLDVVAELEAEVGPVAEVGLDLLGIVVQVDGGLVQAVPREQLQGVTHHRTVEDGDHRLREQPRQRVKAGAESGRHQIDARRCARGVGAGALMSGSSPRRRRTQEPPRTAAAARRPRSRSR